MKGLFIYTMALLLASSSGLFAQNGHEDMLNGHKREYYPNGKIMKEYNLIDGVLQGEYKMYNEEGILVMAQYLTDGQPNGYYRTYFKNGNLQFDGFMKDGMFEGPSKEYYESGKLKTDSNCTGNSLNASGMVNSFNEDGILISETKLANGVPVLVKTYYADGRPKSIQSEGKIVSYWYDINGNQHSSVNGEEQK